MSPETEHVKILTIEEAASFLRVHRSTVTRFALSGDLKSYHIGSRRLFKESDVLEFFENRIAQECVSGTAKED